MELRAASSGLSVLQFRHCPNPDLLSFCMAATSGIPQVENQLRLVFNSKAHQSGYLCMLPYGLCNSTGWLLWGGEKLDFYKGAFPKAMQMLSLRRGSFEGAVVGL